MNKRLIAILVVVATLATVVGALMPAQEALALPCHEYSCEYYSDATYTVLVGIRETICWVGVRWIWGYETEYEICYNGPTCEYCGGCEPVCP